MIMEPMAQDDTLNTRTPPRVEESAGAHYAASSGTAQTLADSPHTIDRSQRESASLQTMDISVGDSQSGISENESAATAAFTVGVRPLRHSVDHDGTQFATLPGPAPAEHSNMTTDFGREAGPSLQRTLRTPPPQTGSGAPCEPPDYEILGELGEAAWVSYTKRAIAG